MLPTAKFPFTVSIESAARRELDYYGPIEALLEEEDAVSLARERLAHALKEGEAPASQGETAWENILAFHAALAAAAKSGSLRLLHRLIEAEARRVQKFLESRDKAEFEWLARKLGVEILREGLSIPWLVGPGREVVYKYLIAAVPASTYLGVIGPYREPRWKLTNSYLLGGVVYLDYVGARDFIVLYSKNLMRSLAEKYRDLELPRLEELGREFARRLDYDSAAGEGPRVEDLPACVAEALRAVQKGRAGPLHLYLVATFLANTGGSPEMLAEALYQGGYADPQVATILAEILLQQARAYTPPRCEVLLEAGVCSECPGEGPLNEYYRSRRRGRRRRP